MLHALSQHYLSPPLTSSTTANQVRLAASMCRPVAVRRDRFHKKYQWIT